ncbi:hypothetical protein [Pseudonocardia sp.]|uniref:hypothetical protein n=1 Tax=Pseudonocardia sp. TaxID=60912 RepID=UPI003D0A8A69
MYLVIVLAGGLGVLAGVAVVMAIVDRSLEYRWRAIAAERRRRAEQRRAGTRW